MPIIRITSPIEYYNTTSSSRLAKKVFNTIKLNAYLKNIVLYSTNGEPVIKFNNSNNILEIIFPDEDFFLEHYLAIHLGPNFDTSYYNFRAGENILEMDEFMTRLVDIGITI